MTTHANPCGVATTWVVWENTWHVTCLVSYSTFIFFFFLLYSCYRATPAYVDRFHRSICCMTYFCTIMCFLGSRWNYSPFGGIKSPKMYILGVLPKAQILKLAYYRNYCNDSNQILHSDRGHKILFMGGPNMRVTKPWSQMVAILKDRKTAISPQRFDRSARSLVRWRILTLPTVSAYCIVKFPTSKNPR